MKSRVLLHNIRYCQSCSFRLVALVRALQALSDHCQDDAAGLLLRAMLNLSPLTQEMDTLLSPMHLRLVPTVKVQIAAYFQYII